MSVPPALPATPPRGPHQPAPPARRRARTVLRAASVLAATAALVATSGAVAAAAPRDAGASADAGAPAGRYFAITPTRVLDTRTTNAPFRDGEARVVDLSKAFAPTASAVVLNLTAVGSNGAGFLAAYPAGTAFAGTSSLNFTPGTARANSVTVAVGSGSYANEVAVRASVNFSGAVHVLVDVVGYYGAGGTSAAGTSYQPLASPVRLFDTRSSIGALTTTYPKNVGIVTIDYGSPAVNRTIAAVAMNITATSPAAAGNLSVWNGFGAPPSTSTLNFAGGQTVANLSIAPVRCTDSGCNTVTFSILNSGSPSTQVIGDIAGAYMTPSSAGLLFTPMSPKRITDSRMPMPYSRLGAGAMGSTSLLDSVPSNVSAVTVNLTAVNPTAATFLSLFPKGVSKPSVSSLNAMPGDIAANAAQVRLGSGGITAFNNAGWTDVVIDLSGMFTRDSGTTAKAASAPAGTVVGGAVTGG